MQTRSMERRLPLSALTTAALLSACASGRQDNPSLASDNDAPKAEVAVTAGELKGANGLPLQALATLSVERDHTLSIYEPSPGVLGVLEARQPNQHPVWERGVSDVLELFARYQPDQAAPVLLVVAYERSLEARQAIRNLGEDFAAEWGGGSDADAARLPAQPEGAVGLHSSALTASSNAKGFVNDGGCRWGSANSFCKVNWTNGFWAQSNGSSQTCDVCAYAGNGVTMSMKISGAVVIALGIANGQCATLTTTGASAARRMEVSNAAGDSFHAGCRWSK